MPNPNEEPSHEGGPEDVGALTVTQMAAAAAVGDLHLADLSDWNPGVNFDDYAAGGRPGVFLKATEGSGFVASTLSGYRAAAHAAGLVFVGLYHFARGGDVNLEAQHFLSTIGTLAPGEVAVLDAEVSGLSASWCRRWLGIVMEATGRDPLLYCSWSYWGDVLSSMTDCPLWIAAYHSLSHDDPRDTVPGCRFWQYADNAQIPGVGSGDDSVFRGSIDDLAVLGGSTAPRPIPPEEADMAKPHILIAYGTGVVALLPSGNVLTLANEKQVHAFLDAGAVVLDDLDQQQLDDALGQDYKPPTGIVTPLARLLRPASD